MLLHTSIAAIYIRILCSVVAPIVTIVTMGEINQSEVNVAFSTLFNMTCNVESYPSPTVHWEVDGKQISSNNVVSVNTSVSGVIINYTCVAVNVINRLNHSTNNSITVIIQGKILRKYVINYRINNHYR